MHATATDYRTPQSWIALAILLALVIGTVHIGREQDSIVCV